MSVCKSTVCANSISALAKSQQFLNMNPRSI